MSSRYYESCDSDGEIRPGRISRELRDALNIPENDLPIWIYRMRALGYPPGWLKKAIVDTSDIFDTEPESSDVQSLKRKSPSSEEIQYDHSKLIEYPGFNAPMPENCSDYHYYINMPAMLAHQQLEYAKQHMSSFKPIQIPKRVKTDISVNDSSHSLDESHAVSSSLDGSTKIENPSSPDVEGSGNSSKILEESFANKSSEAIKLVSKGSPMPKPVERASLEKFSEGVVGDLLYFENLPTSTGKFDSIRGLLNTMRRTKSEANFNATKKDDE